MNFQLFIFLIIFALIIPFFVFAQVELPSLPKTFDKGKETIERILKGLIESLPRILERIWKEEVLPVWRELYNFTKKNFWDPYLRPFLQKIGQKIQVIFKKEMEKRKEIIEKEFQKEKEELKKEIKEKIIPKNTKSLWEKFKELIR